MSSPKFTVRIYPRAENDLNEIKEYFEQKLKTSPNGLFSRFYESITILETNPQNVGSTPKVGFKVL